MGFDAAFGDSGGIFMVFFIIIAGVIVFGIISSISNYAKNASSPILTTRAKVVTKRTQVTHHDHIDSDTNISHSHNSTRYYVTFETDAGQRMELTLDGKEYGLLAEGDVGELIYQGEWFKQFTREI